MDLLSLKARVTAALVGLWIAFPPAMLGLLTMMSLDLLAGLAVAKKTRTFDSKIMKAGVWGKILIGIAAAACFIVSRFIPPVQVPTLGLEIHPDLGSMVCLWLIAGEFISVFRAFERGGNRIPGVVRRLMTGFEAAERRDEQANAAQTNPTPN